MRALRFFYLSNKVESKAWAQTPLLQQLIF